MAYHLLTISNPDSESVSRKNEIDISISLFDVSSSGHYDEIKTNYTITAQKITIPDQEYNKDSLYYTPIYKEKLDYQTWLTRINKNFEELD